MQGAKPLHGHLFQTASMDLTMESSEENHERGGIIRIVAADNGRCCCCCCCVWKEVGESNSEKWSRRTVFGFCSSQQALLLCCYSMLKNAATSYCVYFDSSSAVLNSCCRVSLKLRGIVSTSIRHLR